MIQSSMLDPVIGLDLHIVMVPSPAGPIPTPIPMPFVGIVFDPMGLVTGAAIGMLMGGGPGLVLVNGLPATNCGTEVTCKITMPHIPAPGVSFMPPPMPANDAELYFGSYNISLGGSFGVRLGDIALSCSDPVRLPTSVVLAIPKGLPVLNLRPPAPDLGAIAGAIGMAVLKKVGGMAFRKFRAVQKRQGGLWSKLSSKLRRNVDDAKPSRLRQKWNDTVCFLTGHPVDVATGRVLTSATDFALPGPLPLVFGRRYDSSMSRRSSALGHGWSHSLDQAVWLEAGRVVVQGDDGREVEFLLRELPERVIRPGESVYHPTERLTLKSLGRFRWEVEQRDGTVLEFAPVPGGDAQRARLVRIRSRDEHHAIELVYDARGLLDMVRDAGGRLCAFEHDAHGRLTAFKAPVAGQRAWARHRQYRYDAMGDLCEVVDARGNAWRFEYKQHLLVRETDRTGLSFYFQYDGLGAGARCVRTWGDGGIFDHELAYDPRNGRTVVWNSLAQPTVYELDEAGQVRKITDANNAATLIEYDATCGAKTKETSPLGSVTTMVYDARGNVVGVTSADGGRATIEYDARDLPVRAVDPTGGVWQWRYDALGHLAETVDPAGASSQTEWRDGLVVAAVSAGGRRTELAYDAQKCVTAARLPNGAVIEYRTDELGRVIEVKDARGGVTRRRFDVEGQPVEITAPTG
ncbi:MAG: hypothetical protein EXR73_14625, partial [Myxococcales bacterium]|nr:hypothetical protein [Myxococcales bacterium]